MGWIEKARGKERDKRRGNETVRNGRERERSEVGEGGKGTGTEREREPAGSMPFGRFGESRIASFLLPGLCFPLTSHPLNRAGPLGSRLAPLLSSPVPNPPGLPPDPFCLTFVRPTDRPTVRPSPAGLRVF